MDTFNDFFARSSLKIVKFILKSLTQRDSSSARILQIEETRNHEFFPQVYDTKMFLMWKLKYLNETSGNHFLHQLGN